MELIRHRISEHKVVAAVAGAAIALLAGFFVFNQVGAHSDPGPCFSNGVGLSVTVYRANGSTPVATSGGTVQSGETIMYGATLSHLGGSNCNFEAGTLTITTPDLVPHVVASGAGIPLVTSPSPAGDFVAPQQSYVVSEADVTGGDLDALAEYAGGVAHLGEGHATASADVDIFTPFEDVSLEVTKTADEASEITYEWTIDKSVIPDTWDLFDGDSGTSEYTITLTKSEGISNHSVSGTITIHNPADFADAVITAVTDSISGVGAVSVDCDPPAAAFPFLLGPSGDLVCTYSSALPDSSTRTNTATVTTSGDVGGGSDDETVDFTGVVPVEVNGTVNVTDTNGVGPFGPFSDDTVINYDKTFACGEDEGQHNNTATIVETQQSDDASVVVNCYELEVRKNADESLDRTYRWDIDKVGDQTELILAPGQVFPVNYDVTVNMIGSTDSNWAVNGTITVSNPSLIDAVINSVSDIVSNNGAAVVDCDPPVAAFPYTLLAGGFFDCTYSLTLPDGDSETNTATATQQNYDYDSSGAPTPSGTTDYSGNAPVNFAEATVSEIDKCIDVSDTFPELALAYPDTTVCVGEDTLPKTFEYVHNVGPYTDQECGIPQVVNNTASFVTNDSGAQGSDDHTVNVEVACTCTLTQGYWKTHSQVGPAPYDNNWANLGDWDGDGVEEQEGELLYDPDGDGMQDAGDVSWYTAFWTSPKKGNVWYQLAHQWMAAYLNTLNGADPADVTPELAAAQAWLESNSPAAGTKGKDAVTAAGWASLFGSYNEGLIGPGHCDEQNP